MRIARLHLRNWLSYRGDHVLVLDAKAYALVCRFAHDPDRSNFGGKSALLEAVNFALTGRHRHRTEDDFISRGEPDSAVTIAFDDGTSVTRGRKRGKSTTLDYEGATRDEAQAAIERRLMLTPEDFSNTSYFEQKQMARLVVARPEERMAIVGGWLRLDKLGRAEDGVRERYKSALHQRTMAIERVRTGEMNLKHAIGDCADAAELDNLVTLTGVDLDEARAKRDALQEQMEHYQASALMRDRSAEYLTIVKEGIALKAVCAGADLAALEVEHRGASAEEQAAAVAAAAAVGTSTQRRTLARGEFDGRCPVAGIECPATADINARSRANATRLQEALASEAKLKVALEAAGARERASAARYQEAARREERLAVLRDRGTKLKGDHVASKKLGPAPDVSALRASLSAVQDRIDHLTRETGRLTRAAHDAGKALQAVQDASVTVARCEAELETCRAAMAILGRGGAQRRLAEGALGAIGAGANGLLAACGVDLSIALSWAREGQGLAKHCAECGAAFPASTKAKTCGTCGAERGPLLVQRLEVELSDRSGAAEDFAGIALQLSASQWLRRERGSDWGTLLLDEPTGAMDRAHRKRFTAHLATMLARSQVEQALVVAHDSAVLESLPGRIQIVREGEWSRVEVVA